MLRSFKPPQVSFHLPSTLSTPPQHPLNTNSTGENPLCFIRKVCCYSYFSQSLEMKVLATANVRHISWGEKVMFLHGYPYCSLIRTIYHQATCQRHGGLLQFEFHWGFRKLQPQLQDPIMIISRCWISWHLFFMNFSFFPWPQHANLR